VIWQGPAIYGDGELSNGGGGGRGGRWCTWDCGSSRGGKMSEERRRRLLSPKALGTAWREKRRRGGGPAMHDQVEEKGGGSDAWRRETVGDRCRQWHRSDGHDQRSDDAIEAHTRGGKSDYFGSAQDEHNSFPFIQKKFK
jgi:hypothetical protein